MKLDWGFTENFFTRYKVQEIFAITRAVEGLFNLSINSINELSHYPLLLNSLIKLNFMGKIRQQEVPVTGMSCAACAISVEKTLNQNEGVKKAVVNYANQAAWIEWDESAVDLTDLQEAVKATGYSLLVEASASDDMDALQKKHHLELRNRTIYAGLLALPVFLLGMFWMNLPYANYIMWILTTPVLFIFGRQFFVQAVRQARNLSANMDTLVALSTGIAYLYSTFNTFFPDVMLDKGLEAHVYFEAAAVIIFFILLGKMLESGAKAGTGAALKKLIGLQPTELIVLEEGREILKNTADVSKGEIILIKPGQKIPLDGTVQSGKSFVNESMLTGEPIPVLKYIGDKVYTGTLNLEGSLTFVAEQVGQETVLAQIIQRVKAAQGSKAPVQKLVDKIAGVFVPVVLGISLISMLIWGFSGVEDAWLRGMLAMITVLVIACPCALGLATPTAIIAAMGKGAQMGILIKDAESLEKGKRIDTLILDKTGTITEGKPEVTAMYFGPEWKEEDKYQIAALEAKSQHPLAAAITEKLAGKALIAQPLDFESFTGKGISGKTSFGVYYIGSRKWLESLDIQMDPTLMEKSFKELEKGSIVVYAARNKNLIAIFVISDPIKENAASAVETLKKMGIAVYMLTGDQEKTAAHVTRHLALSGFEAEMLPQDKAGFIKNLQREGRHVAMVGDGINDSEALSVADLSIAMGKGTDIAIEVAEITLVNSDLSLLPKTLMLTKKTVRVIRQNLFWAFIYNIIGIPVAAGILYPVWGFLLNPMLAGAAMALSSVSVVANSLRLK
jgi:P-type Cu2+ transporter